MGIALLQDAEDMCLALFFNGQKLKQPPKVDWAHIRAGSVLATGVEYGGYSYYLIVHGPKDHTSQAPEDFYSLLQQLNRDGSPSGGPFLHPLAPESMTPSLRIFVGAFGELKEEEWL